MKPAKNPPRQAMPLALAHVAAGFPSPAEDSVDRPLDLNEYLVDHPAATFFIRARGDSMAGAGILSGDLLVVDRSRTAADGCVVVAVLDGELTVKRLRKRQGQVFLEAENADYAPIAISGESDLRLWGVVTAVARRL